jgi:hypothetical protein
VGPENKTWSAKKEREGNSPKIKEKNRTLRSRSREEVKDKCGRSEQQLNKMTEANKQDQTDYVISTGNIKAAKHRKWRKWKTIRSDINKQIMLVILSA